ncbi:MAG: hypothetical protein QM676_11705 [Novosphingobium sp.]
MLNAIFATSAALVFAAASTSNGSDDLGRMYPAADVELTKLIGCSGSYVSIHLHDPIRPEKIIEESAKSCASFEQAMFAKIREVNGDTVDFKRRYEATLLRKVVQLRAGGIPENPSTLWDKCVSDNLPLPLSRDTIDQALSRAYVTCNAQEASLREYVQTNAGASEVERAVTLAKDAMRTVVLHILDAQTK